MKLFILAFAVFAQVASAAQFQGTLEKVVFDDMKHKKSREEIHLKSNDGKRLRLSGLAEAKAKKLKSGQKVVVSGEISAAQVISVSQVQVLAEPVEMALTGTRSVVVVPVHFADRDLTCSQSFLQNQMFGASGSIDALFRETSQGALSLTGKVLAPIRINARSNECDPFKWAELANVGNGYDHYVYVFPPAACGYAGIGSFPGTFAANVGYCDSADVSAHEIGHNISLAHAGEGTQAYADLSDFMGYGGVGLRPLNGPHKVQMGWVDSTKLLKVTQAGRYRIAPLNPGVISSSDPMVIQIAKPDSSQNYYLSYRNRSGTDASLVSKYLDGVAIHVWSGGSSATKHIQTLADGLVFADALNGFSIKQVSHDGSGVVIDVEWGGGSQPTGCILAPPSLSLSPSQQSVAAGSTATYSLTIKNLDSAECLPINYQTALNLPSSLSASAIPSVSVAPGASQVVEFKVTASELAKSGLYLFFIRVSDQANSARAYDSSGSLEVIAPDLLAPSAPSGLIAKGTVVRKQSVIQLSWLAATDNVRVVGYRIYRNGSLLTTVNALSFNDTQNLVVGQSYQYQVSAIDAVGNESAKSSVATATVTSKGRR